MGRLHLHDDLPVPNELWVFDFGEGHRIGLFHELFDIGFGEGLGIGYQQVPVLVSLPEQSPFGIRELDTPIEAEVDVLVATVDGDGADIVGRAVGQGPAQGEGVIVVVDELVGVRVEVQDERPQPKGSGYGFNSSNCFCRAYISSLRRAASMKSRSRAALSMVFFVWEIAFSNWGIVR